MIGTLIPTQRRKNFNWKLLKMHACWEFHHVKEKLYQNFKECLIMITTSNLTWNLRDH